LEIGDTADLEVCGTGFVPLTDFPTAVSSAKTMNKIGFTITLFATLLSSLQAADLKPAAGDREGIEWCDVWISHANETNLPRVLLIGDSITRAYYPQVEKQLAGKAYVGRLATSAFVSDPILVRQIAMVLGAQMHYGHACGFCRADTSQTQNVGNVLLPLVIRNTTATIARPLSSMVAKVSKPSQRRSTCWRSSPCLLYHASQV
jgi:hypothetical protein